VTDLMTTQIDHRIGQRIGHIIDHKFGHYTSATSKITTDEFGH